VLADAPGGNPEVIIIASGSEVSLAVNAHENLVAEGVRSRVVSMPSWEIFEHQSQEYRDSVLPPSVKARVAVEQGSTIGWDRYVGNSGEVIGMKTFGASAPLKELQKKFGFEPDQVVSAVQQQLAGTRPHNARTAYHYRGTLPEPDRGRTKTFYFGMRRACRCCHSANCGGNHDRFRSEDPVT
jgi:pyruvate dehydrogenase complex dehydrogenase (E1) component